MRIMNTLCGAALAVIASWSTAEATTLSGNLTSDNEFVAYLSTDDSVLGTVIGSGNFWPTTSTLSQALTAGVTNYLHIIATDQGPPDMFIGSFSLSDNLFHFVNGTQSLLTNTTDWRSDPSGGTWFAPTGTPLNLGPNGTGPWGTFAAMTGADFIWANPNTSQAFFSTAIAPVVAATPIPAAFPLFAAALGGLGLLARRKRTLSV